ncbi:hypothetical protein J6590_030692 [Homalodisca vitripennis]|nr:hypothetical protein J6590_030692 [Homalodisca vitripennis]
MQMGRTNHLQSTDKMTFLLKDWAFRFIRSSLSLAFETILTRSAKASLLSADTRQSNLTHNFCTTRTS